MNLPDPTTVLRQDNQKETGGGAPDVVKSQPTKTVDDLIDEAVPGRKSNRKSTQYHIKGNLSKAVEYFESIEFTKIEDISNPYVKQTMKTLKDGTRVILRESSRGKPGKTGPPTIDIHKVGRIRKIKIRFEE